jgi:hypothetical protein
VRGIKPNHETIEPPMMTGVDPLHWFNTRKKAIRQKKAQKDIYEV